MKTCYPGNGDGVSFQPLPATSISSHSPKEKNIREEEQPASRPASQVSVDAHHNPQDVNWAQDIRSRYNDDEDKTTLMIKLKMVRENL